MAEDLTKLHWENSEFRPYMKANIIFSPEQYKRVIIFGLLYNEVLDWPGHYGEEQAKDSNLSVNTSINQKVRFISGLVKKRIDLGRKLTPADFTIESGLSGSLTAENYVDITEEWCNKFFPFYKAGEKAKVIDNNKKSKHYGEMIDVSVEEANKQFINGFMGGFDESVAEFQYLSGASHRNREKAAFLTTAELREIGDLVIGKVKKPAFMTAKNQRDYKGVDRSEGKEEKKSWKQKVYESKQMLRTKTSTARLETAKAGGQTLVTGASSAATIYGIAMIVGGAFPLGLVITIPGAFLSWKLMKATAKGFGKAFGAWKDRIDYRFGFGKYKDVDDGNGKLIVKSHRGKMIELRKNEAIFEFLKGNGKPLPRHLRKYLPDKMIKDVGMRRELGFYNTVEHLFGKTMQCLNNKLQDINKNSVQDSYSQIDVIVGIQDRLAKGVMTYSELQDFAKYLDTYKGSLGSMELKKYQREISKRAMDTFKNMIFEDAIGTNTDDKIKNAKEVKVIADRLEDSDELAAKQIIENAQLFLKKETGHGDCAVSQQLEASLTDQLIMEKTSIANACTKYGADGVAAGSADYAAAESIADRIVSMSCKKDAIAIGMDINSAFSTKPKVQKYLLHMLKIKENATANDSVTIKNEISALDPDPAKDPIIDNIVTLIRNVTRSDAGQPLTGYDEAKKAIIDSSLESAAKTKALELLKIQTDSLFKAERIDARKSMMDSLKNHESIYYTEYMDKISGIKYSDLSDSTKMADITEFYDKKVVKIRPQEVARYFIIRISGRFEELLRNEIENNKSIYTGNGTDAIPNITKYLQVVGNCRYLNQAQKDKLIGMMEPYMKKAIDSRYDMLRLDITKCTHKEFQDLLTLSYKDGGFKEYFDNKSSLSEKLREKIKYMDRVPDLVTNLEVLSAGGEDVQMSESEIKAFSMIYLKEESDTSSGLTRRTGDQLYDSIVDIKSFDYKMDSSFLVDIDIQPDANKANYLNGNLSIVRQLRSEIDVIDGFANVDDKYAALLFIKKKAIDAFKKYALAFLVQKSGSRANVQAYLNTAAGVEEYTKNVIDLWDYTDTSKAGNEQFGLLTLIDKKLGACVPNLSNNIPNSFTNAVAVMPKMKSPDKAVDFASSALEK